MAQSIPETMFAWRKHKGNPEPVWEEVPVPETPLTGFLCKMLASGVCHSDHSLLTNENQRPWFQEKYILGHEGAGEIISIGDKVQDSHLKVGDHIAMFSVPGCGSASCEECSRDLAQLCLKCHHSGIGQDGFYAPYAAIDVRGAVKLPEGVSPEVGAVATDAVTTAYHAITRRGEVKASETVFLFGLGGLGFNALQIIKHIGPRVIVSDVRQERLDAAEKLGIPREDLVPAGTSVREFLKQRDLYGKIDTVLDFVGVHQTFTDAQDIVRRGGKMVCIGTLNTENTIDMKIGIRKRLSIIFSYGGQLKDLEAALDLIAQGVLRPQVETGRLEEFPTALKDLCDGNVKARVALLFK